MNEIEKEAFEILNNAVKNNCTIGFNDEEDDLFKAYDSKSIKVILNLIQMHQEKINKIKQYAKYHIDTITEDIEDYIDDDRVENKHIIGEFKEDREHWKDIIKIIENEENKLYLDIL